MSAIESVINKLVDSDNLARDESEEVMRQIMSGEATPAQIGAFLSAMRVKGETPTEIASFARIMREFASDINPDIGEMLVDTCGTGGDEIDTFNISTTAMLIAAGAGVPIAKHGNRSVTSKSGSADVLEAMGVNIDLSPERVESCIEDIGIGFMYAPRFHKAMKYAAGPRKEINLRTVFNILGPLTNPAGAQAQVIGVYDPALTEKLAKVLKKLELKRAMVVHGLDGLDEISTLGETKISELNELGKIRTYTVKPENFGISRTDAKNISGGDAEKNAKILIKVLKGEKGCCRDIALLNAASAILVGSKAEDLQEAISIGREAIESGRAYGKMKKLIVATGGDLQRLERLEESI